MRKTIRRKFKHMSIMDDSRRAKNKEYQVGFAGSSSRKRKQSIDDVQKNSDYAIESDSDNKPGYLIGKNVFYDGPGSSLISTQQINLDYSKFENHTFFDSATSKVNIAFDKIINEFPYDGTKSELTEYMTKRTGFEKYVFDNFNKSFGYLNFSGSDSYIDVKDIAGNLYPDISKNNTGESILSPVSKPFSIEFSINPPAEANDCQTIFQFSGSNSTISGFLSESIDTSSCKIHFHILSGTSHSYVSASIDKGSFSHISLNYPGEKVNDELLPNDYQKMLLYIDGNIASRSSQNILFDDLSITGPANFYIGSGSTMYTPELESDTNFFVPKTLLSSSIDEFRFYHRSLSQTDILNNMYKNVMNENDLKLYLKFNEIIQSNSIKNVVIDSSGNSLHSRIQNYSDTMRIVMTGSGDIAFSHMYKEQADLNPVLFMSDVNNDTLNNNLIASASLYDDINPNLITRLVPGHYFEEGQVYQGLSNITGSQSNKYSMTSIPGSGKLGSGQLLASFLLIWAKHFDELKIYIDTMSRIHDYGLQDNDVPVDNYLLQTGRKYGLELPGLFNETSSHIFNEKAELANSKLSNFSLQQVQNKIWKRILNNYQDILKQKGTISSIKQIIRTVGLEPDKYFNIREFGGNKRFYLEGLREKRITKRVKFLDFSGSLGAPAGDVSVKNYQGFAEGSPFIVGSPLIDDKGRLIARRSDFPEVSPYVSSMKERFLTSGSFTYEAIYKFDKGIVHFNTQSLCRLSVTGSISYARKQTLTTNLLAVKDSNTTGSQDKVILYCRPYMQLDDHVGRKNSLLKMEIKNIDLFNGKPWYVSFGRVRNDDVYFYSAKNNNLNESPLTLTSSFFLRCSELGSDSKFYQTSSFFVPHNSTGSATSNNGFFEGRSTTIDTNENASGSFIVIGSQSIETGTNYRGLNYNKGHISGDETIVPIEARHTNFSGKINFINFYSKSTSEKEARERSRNPYSIGTDNPVLNFGHIDSTSSLPGAFNRLRMKATIADQFTTSSDSLGSIRIFDYSQNNYHFQGGGFEPNKDVFKKETIIFNRISPKFSELQSNDKVRVRGYDDMSNAVNKPWAMSGSVFEIPDSKRYYDDARLSIETSIIKTLDENIINMIGSLETFDQILGEPSNMFESEYIGLENLRKQYFNELTEKLDINGYSDFFTWFDDTLTSLILDFIPVRSKFLGVNNVIESHILERNKNKYYYDKMYAINEYEAAGYFDNNGSNLGLSNLGGDD